MEDVQQAAGVGVARLDQHVSDLAHPRKRLGPAPHFQLRDNPQRAAYFKQLPVPLGHAPQIECDVIRPAGRRGHANAADRRHKIGIALPLLQAGGAAGIVVVDPIGKADRAGYDQTEIGYPLLQVGRLLIARHVATNLLDPGLDGVIAGLGGNLDLLGQGELLAANRGRVQAEFEPGRRDRGLG